MDQPPGSKLDQRTVVLVSVAKRQWERTFDAISEPLMIVDDDYVIRRANLALADDLGMAVQRVVGRRCYEARAESQNRFPIEATGPCTGCPVPAARARSVPEEAEMRSPLAGRVYRLRAYPLVDEEVRMTVCSYRDVTDERLMSRQLAHAEKLASIGRLAGGVAHEINNPLGGILAFTQILMKEDVAAEERQDCLREIERSALRCKAIVESLLRFSRQSPHAELRAVSLNECVQGGLRAAAQKLPLDRVKVEARLARELPAVLGEASQLEQVVLNLVTNAVDSALGGTSDVPRRVEVRTSVEDGVVKLEVEDNGPGVDERHVEKLYDPFFTTKEEGKGMGLGLAVTYAILQEIGGAIAVRNLPGRGAVFTVSLAIVR
jgi:C4-dicarboxylate-specific signal transduction histidine kinase